MKFFVGVASAGIGTKSAATGDKETTAIMTFDKKQLREIYDRTTGYCHLCRKKLSWRHYGQIGRRGAWEVEHSVAQRNGGTHHGNNLYAACCDCNRKKGSLTTRTARGWNGFTRAPMCVERRKAARAENTVLGMVGGGVAGFVIGGPIGCAIGIAAGGKFGNSLNPDETG